MGTGNLSLSVVIPLFNEKGNIKPLYAELKQYLNGIEHEIIFVDDGSTDGSREEAALLAGSDPKVKLIALSRNFGQSAAFQAGFDNAKHDVIVTMDGDMQNDPKDIIPMLKHLEETGADITVGWRRRRKDPLLKKIPSRIANRMISRFLGLNIHDTGCSMKVFRSDMLSEVKLYGEMHRFIPYLLFARGARVTEMEVNHRHRLKEKSKYGMSRTSKVILDMLTVKFLNEYSTNPIYMIGGLSIATFSLSMIALILLAVMKIFWKIDMTGNPLLLISVFLFMVSVQIIMLGLISEIQVRIYFETGKKEIYKIREIVHGNKE